MPNSNGQSDDLGPGQFGQCSESAVVPERARSRLSAHRCRHGVRPQQRARLSRDESQRARADPGGRRFRAVGIQFDHALSRARLSAGIADLSAGAESCAPRVDRWLDWTLSTLQPVDRPVFWALVRTPIEKRDMVAIQKDADAEAVAMADPRRPIGDPPFHRRRSISPSPTLRSAPMRGAGSGSKASRKPRLPHLERWFAQFAARPGFRQFVAPPMT